jgi:hypothetical protein
MKFTSLTIATVSILSALSATGVSGAPIAELDTRDVFVPPITYPHAGTVWKVGQRHNVSWDISSRPVNITNSVGRIMLRKGDLTTPVILADKFSILLGRIEVTVPWVTPDSDYQLVLFGDSGNFSPKFTIKSA